MYERDREPLDRFLYRINQKQAWAGVFSFAMTIVGLLAVMGLVILTVWGFSSYNTTKTKLTETNAELSNSQRQITELRTIANSNSAGADLVRLQTELADAKQQLSQRDLEIADLRKQLENSNSAPGSQVGPAKDCSACEGELKTKDGRIAELLGSYETLKNSYGEVSNQLKECQARTKRPAKTDGKTTVLQ